MQKFGLGNAWAKLAAMPLARNASGMGKVMVGMYMNVTYEQLDIQPLRVHTRPLQDQPT